MKFLIWTLAATFLTLAASCNLLNPTASQATIEVSNETGGDCPLGASLDGNYAVTIQTGTYYTFPLVNAGSHTLNFWTYGNTGNSGQVCKFTNSGAFAGGVSFNSTFNTSGGTVYVGAVTATSGGVWEMQETTTP